MRFFFSVEAVPARPMAQPVAARCLAEGLATSQPSVAAERP